MAPDSVRISDGHGHWTHIDPTTPLTPVAPVGIPHERVRAFLDKVESGTAGHLVDPTGSGRWLATPVRMWNDAEDRGKRKEFLR